MLWYGVDLRWAYVELLPSIYRNTQCMHFAHDVLHDALLRFALTKNPERIRQPQAYLRTVVRNVLADSHRDMARFVSLWPANADLTDDGHSTAIEQMLEDKFAPSPEHLADLQQRMQMLQKIIDCLPPRCREVFWLFRIEGMSQAQIADHLSISVNMVERHVMRALVDLSVTRDLLVDS